MTMGEYEPNDSRKVALNPDPAGKAPAAGWKQEEAQEPQERYEPEDSRRITQGQEQGAKEPTTGAWRQQEAARAPVRQHNNAQEVTGGDLPDPDRAEHFDQDEG
jgi:hypothetical protein